MPLYDYKCTGCHSVTEIKSSIVERDHARKCNKCGSELVRKEVNRILTKIEGYCFNNERAKGDMA